MENVSIWMIILIAGALYLNIVAMYHLLSIDSQSKKQKILQGLVIWMVPIFGAVLVSSFHLSDKDYVKEQKSRKGLSPKIVNLLTFVAFAAGYGGTIAGIHDSGSNDFGGYDSGGGDSGGGGADG